MHDNFYIKCKHRQKERNKTHTYTNHKNTRERNLFLGGINRKSCLKNESSSSLNWTFYFMTIDHCKFLPPRLDVIDHFISWRNRLSHDTHTHSTPTGRYRRAKANKKESKREEIIDKRKEAKATQCWTSIEDSFMDFNVSFRS